VADWGERNMGDPQTLIDFIQWSQANYPAEHYATVFWDHGWGWRPYQAMWDETDDDMLDQHEIVAAMDVVGPVDVVGYDAPCRPTPAPLTHWAEFLDAYVNQ